MHVSKLITGPNGAGESNFVIKAYQGVGKQGGFVCIMEMSEEQEGLFNKIKELDGFVDWRHSKALLESNDDKSTFIYGWTCFSRVSIWKAIENIKTTDDIGGLVVSCRMSGLGFINENPEEIWSMINDMMEGNIEPGEQNEKQTKYESTRGSMFYTQLLFGR